MVTGQQNEPEQIESTEILPTGRVTIEEKPSDIIRIKGALWIAGASVFLATVFLVAALFLKDRELMTWATGLISLVVGAAIGFVFSGKS